MTTSNELRVSELDFDTIKENLTSFLRSKPEFKDYDFTGSALSTLLGVLAYNTHYNAVLDNQAAQELTLDTSTNRIVTALHAKRLGYTPTSLRCARAIIDLEIFPSGNPTTLTLGTNATFNSVSSSDRTFVFNTIEPRTIKVSNNRWIFKDVEIIEGQSNVFRYVYGSRKKFEIPTNLVDVSTLRVFVQTSQTNTKKVEFIKTDKITDLNFDSTVFFVQMNRFGKYEVYFGDDIIGKSPVEGNVIELRYFTGSGAEANDIQQFQFTDLVEGNGNNSTITIAKSYGGMYAESNDSIKYNAYKNTIVQDRAVTSNDYEAIIPTIYPLDSISVWGGESNTPPVYGRVFISIKPKSSDLKLTQASKDYITRYLADNKSIVTISPIFVDVDYVYIDVNSVVYIDDTVGTHSPSYIRTKVINTINSYSTNNLGKFNKIFRFSKLGSDIDNTDQTILSNLTNIYLFKKFIPVTTSSSNYTITFNNPALNGSISSTSFRIGTQEIDLQMKDKDGKISFFYNEGGVVTTLIDNAGTIDYDTGTIQLFTNMFSSFQGEYIKVSCSPKSKDVISLRETIVKIEPTSVDVTVIQESKNGSNHIFSES